MVVQNSNMFIIITYNYHRFIVTLSICYRYGFTYESEVCTFRNVWFIKFYHIICKCRPLGIQYLTITHLKYTVFGKGFYRMPQS